MTLVSPDMVAAQITAIRADIRIDAVKIGMLGSAGIIAAVAAALEGLAAPVVLDPVMVAKAATGCWRPRPWPRCATGCCRWRWCSPPTCPRPPTCWTSDLDTMAAQAAALRALGPRAVLIKGGHPGTTDSPDLLIDATGVQRFDGPRHATRNTHGTGCSFSAALACELGHGRPLPQAVARAKAWLADAIAAAECLDVGTGHGPVHHFHAMTEVRV